MSQKFSLFFLTKLKKTETKNNFVLSCSFDPIKIRTRLAPQNVHKNLSFVKDTNVVCQNMTRKCCKLVQKPICALHFRYVFTFRQISVSCDSGKTHFVSMIFSVCIKHYDKHCSSHLEGAWKVSFARVGN